MAPRGFTQLMRDIVIWGFPLFSTVSKELRERQMQFYYHQNLTPNGKPYFCNWTKSIHIVFIKHKCHYQIKFVDYRKSWDVENIGHFAFILPWKQRINVVLNLCSSVNYLCTQASANKEPPLQLHICGTGVTAHSAPLTTDFNGCQREVCGQ